MRKVAVAVALTITILAALCHVSTIEAQTDSNIVITADGTVTPSTTPIQQNGATYTLTSSYEGTLLIQRSNIVFDGNRNFIQSPDNVGFCVKLDCVSNVTVSDLIVRGSLFGCMYGVELEGVTNCLITNNTIADVWSISALNGIAFDGIHVNGGNSNVFSQNTLVNNMLGMHFGNTTNNLIIENSIDYISQKVNSVPSGINFYRASGNLIYHNTFRAEHTQVLLYESNNTWDNGFPSGGNYWSNYGVGGSNYTKIAGTRIYDCPYLINDGNTDHYPLVEPYTATTPLVTISSAGGNYNMSSVPLSFTVDQPAAWMGYSLDGFQNVTLSGNQTLTDLTNGGHKVTVYANDSFGNMGYATFEFTVSLPLSTGLIAGVFVFVVAVAVVAGFLFFKRHKKSLTA